MVSKLPSEKDYLSAILKLMEDGKVRSWDDLYDLLINYFNLTEEQIEETSKDGHNKHWVNTYFPIYALRDAGFLKENTRVDSYEITELGRAYLKKFPNKKLTKNILQLLSTNIQIKASIPNNKGKIRYQTFTIDKLTEDMIEKVYLHGGLQKYFSLSQAEKLEANQQQRVMEEEVEISELEINNKLAFTEKETIVKSRVGQGKYRKDLLALDNGKCALTGLNNDILLMASHIKPWKDCNNKERIDPHNGLLLSPNMDKLFDNGLISFNNDGMTLISEVLLLESRAILNIPPKLLCQLSPKRLKYLDYHRKHIFID